MIRFERREGNAALDQFELLRDVARGAHRARRADRASPTETPKRGRDWPQLQPHCEARTLETLRAQLTVVEMRAAHADAADRQALEMLRLVAFADDELRAAAADVDDEVRSLRRIGVVRHAEIDRAAPPRCRRSPRRDGRALPRPREECVAVARTPQRVRADDTNLVRVHVAQPLAEAPQAGERALLARVVEIALLSSPDARRTISRSRSMIDGWP